MRRTIALVASALFIPLALAATTSTGSAHEFKPPTYHWVDPPADAKPGNVKPATKTDTSALTPSGSPQIASGTDDGQVTLNLAVGAIAAHGADSGITIKIVPLAPKALGATPTDLAADGNAYRVTLTYSPSDTAIPTFTKPGTILLVTPEPASELLFSNDGKSWSQLELQPTGDSDTIAATFARSGYYLAAEVPTAPSAPTSGGGSSGTGRVVLLTGLIIVLALGLVFVPRVLARRRR